MDKVLDLEIIAKENEKYLDEAKLHTQYKIKYIKDYVRRWLNVAVNYRQRNIVFIDSMCNAGIYKNGIKGTCIEVIELFIEYAKENDFFTSSYEFSDSDFFDDVEPKKNGILKIILLFLAVVVFAGVIAYFVINYGIGV